MDLNRCVLICPRHMPILNPIGQPPAHLLLWHLAWAVHHHHLAQHLRAGQQEEESLGHLDIVLSQIFYINIRLARSYNVIAAYHCSSSAPNFVKHHPQEGGVRSPKLWEDHCTPKMPQAVAGGCSTGQWCPLKLSICRWSLPLYTMPPFARIPLAIFPQSVRLLNLGMEESIAFWRKERGNNADTIRTQLPQPWSRCPGPVKCPSDITSIWKSTKEGFKWNFLWHMNKICLICWWQICCKSPLC